MPEEHGCKRVMCITNVSSGFSHVQLFVTPWAVALQASLSMGFSRLLCPWDSPGFSVHRILQASLSMGFSRLLCPWNSPGFSVHGILQAPLPIGFSRLLCPWDSPGKNTRVGCHALLQRIFHSQGSETHLSHLLRCQAGCWPPARPGNSVLPVPGYKCPFNPHH